VPCAQLTTGQPPFGALPFGIATVPDSTVPLPLADVERYSSSVLAFALFSTAGPVSLRCQTGVPCGPLGRLAGGV
jgi:hypothetical protein